MATADTLSQDLTCAVCLELYTNPKVLQCMHTYCHDCMVSLVQSGRDRSQKWRNQWTSFIVCPECRQNTNIDGKGVAGLSTNFALLRIVDTYRNTSKNSTSPSNVPCSLCEDSTKFAVKTCVDCPQISYCESCLSLFHPPRGVLKNHKLVLPSLGKNTNNSNRNNSITATEKKKCLTVPSITSLQSRLTNRQTAKVSIEVSRCQEALQYHVRCENSNPPNSTVQEFVLAKWSAKDNRCTFEGLRHETLYLVSVAAEYKEGTSSYCEERVLYTEPQIRTDVFLLDLQEKHKNLDLDTDRLTVAHCDCQRHGIEDTVQFDPLYRNCGITADRVFSDGCHYWEVHVFYQVVGRLNDRETFATFGIYQVDRFRDKHWLDKDFSCVCVTIFRPWSSSEIVACVWDGPKRRRCPSTVISTLNRKPVNVRFGFFLNMNAMVLKVIHLDANFVLETLTELGIEDAVPVCSVSRADDAVAVKIKFVTGNDAEVPDILTDQQ